MSCHEALIFNIQHCSIHDGPGIRTVVFFKGCSLRCRWCSNPESISLTPDVAWKESVCIGCASCVPACPNGLLNFSPQQGVAIDRQACTVCGMCAAACPAKALSVFGKTYAVDALFEQLMLDTGFFARSGGGVTLSGGEPLLQAPFAAELLRRIREERFSTCIETCGNYKYTDAVDEALRHTDSLMFDIKHVDAEAHRQYTGADPDLIMKNLHTIAREHPNLPITVRTPVIPSFNDTDSAIQAIARFAASIPTVRDHELLPYHNFGQSKYAQLGLDYTLNHLGSPDKAHMDALSRTAKTFAVNNSVPL